MIEHRLSELLLRPRVCAADWLIQHARGLCEIAEATCSPTVLVIGCLECRNAIEQLWVEIFMLLKGGSVSRQQFADCRRRRDGFLAAIGEVEPAYRKLSRFTVICAHLDSQSPDVTAWDLGRLKKLWHALSGYCHAQGHPAETIDDPKWFEEGCRLVGEACAFLAAGMSDASTGILQPANMTPDARGIWEDFLNDQIDEEQVVLRLRIVQPLKIY